MLTTKKRVGETGFPSSQPGRAAFALSAILAPIWRRNLLVGCFLAALAFLTGCMPSGPKALLRGEALIREGRYKEAVNKLEDAVQLLPENAQAWNHLGLAYHHLGETGKASSAYERALKLDRNLFVAYYNLGNLRFESGDWAGAAEAFTGYTLFRPQPADGWLKLGLAQLRLHQWDAAERSLKEALARDRHQPEALNGMGLVEIQRRRYPDAYNYFNAALNARTNYPPALLNVAVTAHQYLRNQRPFALQAYRAYLALQPTPANAPAVQAIAQQLEWELNPQLRPSTTNLNRIAAVISNTIAPPLTARTQQLTALPSTNAVVALVTNAPPKPVASVPPTRVATAPPPVVTNTPAAKPAPAPTTPPPAQTATVTPPPQPVVPTVEAPKEAKTEPKVSPPPEPPVTKVVVAANDEAPPVAHPAATPPVAKPAPQPEPVKAPETVADKTATPSETPTTSTQPEEQEKPGFFQRLNPKRWFGGREKPLTTPLPAKPGDNSATPKEVASAATPLPEPDTKPAEEKTPPRPEVPRYTYQHPAKPADGDRAKAERLFVEAYAAHQAGQLAAAIPAYKAAVAADPGYYDVRYNLAVAALQAGDLAQSLSASEAALAINPGAFGARYNFALALQRAGFSKDAANELERLLQDRPNDANAQLFAANIYAQNLLDYEGARKHYLKLLELEPRHPQAVNIRNWLAAHP
ncbi:MAG TPA: tetratricopeptide repeat protein [Verrucomicrobiae bacterium]|nr:tetratricopeptide repeat protein [Verrucomicrobiae bacterium]